MHPTFGIDESYHSSVRVTCWDGSAPRLYGSAKDVPADGPCQWIRHYPGRLIGGDTDRYPKRE